MTETDGPVSAIEFAYGQGYTDALIRVADDLHTQFHVETEKSGNGDPRALAFFETSKILRENAELIENDLQKRGITDD